MELPINAIVDEATYGQTEPGSWSAYLKYHTPGQGGYDRPLHDELIRLNIAPTAEGAMAWLRSKWIYSCDEAQLQGPRTYQQDRMAVVHHPAATWVALADGMGGHDQGEVAAQAVVDTLRGSFDCTLHEMLHRIKARIRKDRGRLSNAGTTLLLARITPSADRQQRLLEMVSIGDSFWCLVRNNAVYQQGLLDNHPEYSNILSRSMPDQDVDVVPVFSIPLQPGDQLLMMSDGVYDVFPTTGERITGIHPADQASFVSLDRDLTPLLQAIQNNTPLADLLDAVKGKLRDNASILRMGFEAGPAGVCIL